MRLCLILLLMSTLAATDYHLATDGDDAAAGTGPDVAWATWDRLCRHVEEHGLQPGDRVLLRAGDRFTTTRTLSLDLARCHGEAGRPVEIRGHGGPATVAVAATHGFLLWAEENGAQPGGHVHLSDLELVGDGEPHANDGRNASGILIWNTHRDPLPGLVVERVTVRGFAGNGIEAGRAAEAGRLVDLRVVDCLTVDNTGAAGVAPHSGSGIVIGGGERAEIARCRAARNGERNDNPGGPIGIWLWDSIDSVIRDCVSHDNRSVHGDGGGFDLDGACQRCVIERCLSAHNVGAGYLLAQFKGAHQRGPLADNVIRFCISVDDGRQDGYAGITLWGAGGKDVVGPTVIEHCTVIATRRPDGPRASAGVRVWNGARPQGVVIRDTILVAGDGQPLFHSAKPLEPSQLRFERCAWLTAPDAPWRVVLPAGTITDLAALQATGLARDGIAGTSPWPLPIPLEPLRIEPTDLAGLGLLRLPAGHPLHAVAAPLAAATHDLGGRPLAAGQRALGATIAPAD